MTMCKYAILILYLTVIHSAILVCWIYRIFQIHYLKKRRSLLVSVLLWMSLGCFH